MKKNKQTNTFLLMFPVAVLTFTKHLLKVVSKKPLVQLIVVVSSTKTEKWAHCFPFILRSKSSLQICCNPTVCSKNRVIRFKFCCNSMISQPLPNFKSQFCQKEEVGSYDNIALNQRNALPFSVQGFHWVHLTASCVPVQFLKDLS